MSEIVNSLRMEFPCFNAYKNLNSLGFFVSWFMAAVAL